jgi:hypothetical protein
MSVDDHAVGQPPETGSLFVPLTLLSLAFIGWLGFLTFAYMGERQQLHQVFDSQQPQIDAAKRMRAALDGLASSTQHLANQGNPNARLLVDELGRRGVTINQTPSASAQ